MPKQPSHETEPALSLQLSVDRTSPVPLYFQLSQQLEAAIERGALTPGTLLGNEIELAGRLGLSRPTVRQAIQSLVDKGLLVRRRGVGTQVVHSQVKRPLELSSLYDDLEAAGQRPATVVLNNAVEPASAAVAAALGVAEGSEVRVVERLRYAHGEPMARLRNHLPAGLLDCDTAALESTGLYRIMRAAGITLHSARQSVGARAADAAEAELLGEETGAPLLTMERTTFDDTGRAVEFGSHLYRASRYAFEFQLLVRS
ncbi:GntR family transcriptional regulator [Streptomyces sp. NPDC018833]|uniref:GntR family transcriptional regulator n=1 Tax=Streptomyces sp. NPDC018833 TaxID=3365053 RepID=UPI00379896BA